LDGEFINAYVILAGRHVEIHPLGGLRRTWDDNMDGSLRIWWREIGIVGTNSGLCPIADVDASDLKPPSSATTQHVVCWRTYTELDEACTFVQARNCFQVQEILSRCCLIDIIVS
jgi:hypothetical protein